MTEGRLERRHGLVLGGVAVAVALVAALVALGGDDDDGSEIGATDRTTTTSAPTTSTSAATTTTFAPSADPRVGVFPAIGSSRRFHDPVAAAVAFATDFVGFTDPVVGDFRAGDPGSGEVDIRPREDGPVTTVLLRLLGHGAWTVTGAATDDIVPETPEVDAVVGSTLTLAGEALAFEGTVVVDVREQGAAESIGEAVVTGSGVPPAGPYEGAVEFSDPSTDTGAVLHRAFSAEDGSVSSAAVVRVQFTAPG